jgi:hypothetical protein
MNINPTADSTQPHNIQPQPMPPSIKPTVPNKYKLRQASTDRFQPGQFPNIAKAWKENPDVRPDVIAAAKQFVTDSNYPTPAQLSQLAKMIVDGDQSTPASTQTPLTEPPMTEPPASTQTPMTEPPITEPPMTEPPTIEPIPPVTISAASGMTEPPMTEPPTIEPMSPVTVSAASGK